MAIPTSGSELAGCRIDGLIGRGGMGVVYRGTDLRLGRRVAIKLIAADRSDEPAIRERFEREARLMAAIDHPNVVPVYAAGEDHGCLYLVMRYVAGTDLAALLNHEDRLEPARAVRITEQIAQALDAAHAAGLVHRDIKPANVLLAGDHVYLSDFGIGRAMEAATRLTDSRDWLGTVDFCSPEQLRCARVDSRSDVYALGCLLHTALTGIPPHHRETAAATMLAHLNEPPPPASATTGVPDRLDAVLARALAKRPADRYATAGELAQAARAALEAGARSAETRRTARRPLATVGSQARKSLETVASRTRRLPRATRIRAPARTKLDLRPRPDSGAPRPGTRPAPRRLLALAAAVTLLVAAAVAAAALALSARPRPPGPLTGADIASAVHAFAGAYGHRDSNALASLLAADVTRVTPGATERGRAAVAAVYRRQLTDGSIVGYQVATLEVVPGWVGRASARYSILRIGRPTVSGRVTFGIERVRGRIRIGLIAAQPADH